MAKEISPVSSLSSTSAKSFNFSKAFQSSWVLSQSVLTFFIDKVAGKFGRDFIYKKKKKEGRVNGAERQTEYT